VMNTFLWPLDSDPTIRRGGKLAASWLGGLLYRHLNIEVKVLLPKFMHNRAALTPRVHEHYARPLGSPDERMGAWTFARALLAESAWYQSLWDRRATLSEKPMLLAWGVKDPAFGPAYLARWREAFPQATVQLFENSGHFVAEEVPGELGTVIDGFMAQTRRRATVAG